MRKLISAIAAAALLASIFTSATFAGTRGGPSDPNGCAWGQTFWTSPSCSNTPNK